MPTIQTNCFWQTLLCLIVAIPSLAQPVPVDSTNPIPGARAAIFYQSYVGADAPIYNGIAYQPNYRGLQGSPYFQTDNLTDGSLIYENLTYNHIPLLYNLVYDQLVISDPSGQLLIPPADKLQQFTFAGHHFIRITLINKPGYYEVLGSGYTTLLAKHIKKIEEKIEYNELHHYISTHDEYYIYKQDQYHPVASGNSLLTLLADKKKELDQFRRSRRIRFKKNPESAMLQIIDYYNQLPH